MTKPLLHFCHGNSFPSGTYRQMLDALGAHYEVHRTDMVGHHPDYPVDDNWHALIDELRENRILWLLVAVPVVLVMARTAPESHTLLFGVPIALAARWAAGRRGALA